MRGGPFASNGLGVILSWVKRVATTTGVVLVVLGILGLIPQTAPEGVLLGLFRVNPALSIFYIASGLGGLWAASVGAHASRGYLRIFGAAFLGLAVIGFSIADGYILGVFANNAGNNWLHLAFALLFLVFGFAPRKSPISAASEQA